jgi:hypothetical protein
VASAGETRRYFCNLQPAVRRNDALPLGKDFDYLKLSFGELEHFEISVNTTAVRIFRVRVGPEYTIAGESKIFTSLEIDKVIGFFDTVRQASGRSDIPPQQVDRPSSFRMIPAKVLASLQRELSDKYELSSNIYREERQRR